jgi:hypothetical protein
MLSCPENLRLRKVSADHGQFGDRREQREPEGRQKIIERAGEVDVTAPAVVAAVQAYSTINTGGQWIDRSEHVELNDLFEKKSKSGVQPVPRVVRYTSKRIDRYPNAAPPNCHPRDCVIIQWPRQRVRSQKSPVATPAVIVCSTSFLRPRLRKVCDPGVARCAGHPYVVHKLPRSLHHK